MTGQVSPQLHAVAYCSTVWVICISVPEELSLWSSKISTPLRYLRNNFHTIGSKLQLKISKFMKNMGHFCFTIKGSIFLCFHFVLLSGLLQLVFHVFLTTAWTACFSSKRTLIYKTPIALINQKRKKYRKKNFGHY